MRAATALLFVLLPGTSLGADYSYGSRDAPRDISPAELGELFCQARLADDMRAVEPFFAPKLAEAISLAEQRDEEFRTSRPDEATPLADGIPWQGRAVRPTSCTVDIVNGADDTINVLVSITYAGPDGSWSDTLNLERTEESWDLNNVFYDGGGNLRFKLADAFAAPAAS